MRCSVVGDDSWRHDFLARAPSSMADAALRELHGQESFFHLVDILLSLSLSLYTYCT